jgi:hypothetical protein
MGAEKGNTDGTKQLVTIEFCELGIRNVEGMIFLAIRITTNLLEHYAEQDEDFDEVEMYYRTYSYLVLVGGRRGRI